MAELNVREDFWSDLPQVNLAEGNDVKTTLYQFKGFWFLLPFLQRTQEVLTHFKPLPTDVILTSFPKTGTTWLKAILYSILNRPSLSSTPDSSSSALTSNHPHDLIPSLEIQVFRPSDDFSNTNTSAATAEEMSLFGSSQTLQSPDSLNTGKRRIFNTHIPYQLFADHSIDSSDCKIVYVTRNPKDTLVSFWNFMKKLQGATSWSLDGAVDKFCSGPVPYGPYYDHVLRYKKESSARPDKFFFTTYEELTNDTEDVVKRLAEFLGCPFDKREEEGQILEKIVKNCSIDTLKSHGINKSDDIPCWLPLPYNSFFRQGRVGDHKNYLTPEMIERIDAVTREKFHGVWFHVMDLSNAMSSLFFLSLFFINKLRQKFKHL